MEVTIYEVNDFEDPNVHNMIGRGGFGTVHKLKSKKDNIYYAVKIMFGENVITVQDTMMAEVKIISQLSYPTLLKFHGITFSFPYYLITEFIPNHSVQYFIDKSHQGQ